MKNILFETLNIAMIIWLLMAFFRLIKDKRKPYHIDFRVIIYPVFIFLSYNFIDKLYNSNVYVTIFIITIFWVLNFGLDRYYLLKYI